LARSASKERLSMSNEMVDSGTREQGAKVSRRTLFAGGFGLLALAACGKDPSDSIANRNGGNKNEVQETEEPEINLLDRDTFDIRPEPMARLETAWPAIRERLDSLGATPQVVEKAYEFTDKAKRSPEEPMGSEEFEQLSYNLLIGLNIIAANQRKFPPESAEHSSLIRSSLQYSLAMISWGDAKRNNRRINMATDSGLYQQLQEELLSKVSEEGVIRKLSITEYNSNPNDDVKGGIFIEATYDNEDGGVTTVTIRTPSSIEPSILMSPVDPNDESIGYEPSTDYDKPVQIGIY